MTDWLADHGGVHGTVAEGFEPVAETFIDNFAERGEIGASVSVYADGEKVVDLWGGCANHKTGEPWRKESAIVVFSTTKGAAAICVAMLVDQGLLDYGAPVARYWPEFAANGKQDITVGQLMSHQAGLIYVDPPLPLGDILEVTPIVEALAAQAPLWEPGTKHGYHALTYGWLAGELVRRVDGRSLGTFFAEEVAEPLGLDFWIGLPEDQEWRVARLRGGAPPQGEELELMRRIAGPGTKGGRALYLDGALSNPIDGEMPFNTRAVRASEIPAANGVANAAAVARLYAATIGEIDGVQLLSPEVVDAVRAQRVFGPDESLVLDTRIGYGFMLHCDELVLSGDGAFGHYGAGGSLGFADPERGLAFGYVMNQMGGGIASDPRAVHLLEAARDAL
ncbi:MAG: serine hydrolase domain-containing protein [Actinomycetota bacterium]